MKTHEKKVLKENSPVETYLTFSLNGSLYGLESNLVEEVFFLPELTPIPEAPRYIVGVFNLRGDIIPVMDLLMRFGYQPLDYSLSDSVVVLQYNDSRFGIIVNQVHEVKSIAEEEVTQALKYEKSNGFGDKSLSQKGYQKGVAKSQDKIIVLLNVNVLARPPEKHHRKSLEALFQLETEEEWEELQRKLDELEGDLLEQRVFCPHISEEERTIFRERAKHLQQSTAIEDLKGFKSLAIIGLGGELFGIQLNIVREFTNVEKVTPVPCCPPHIIGNMNLRGEIVTLVDIGGLLNLQSFDNQEQKKVMVIDVDGLVLGIIVDEVFDVLLVNPSQITAIPTALHGIDDEYLEGAAMYQKKMMSILALSKILLQGELVVDEVI